MSLWDDLGNFGSGMLDTVGEGVDNLVQHVTKPADTTHNAGTTQQPQQPVKDNHGNAVTGQPLPPATSGIDKKTLMIGGGILAAVSLLGLILAVRK
ncbi:hypothetical protein [Photobacterium halotolerans]|uniref:Uncharacterized protein n=1 Tax=Photobacterium halotolerans TaxID=265726 RepID=A0A7X5ASF8_9GAMM|nr:hypothetical protein [Photobacterium halotolerans]NAW66139.1 hypothetical protein [Photobacterium halotolerans]